MMARALRLAERGAYTARPNPMVGCVIAHGEEIVGEGWHQRTGGPHAEPPGETPITAIPPVGPLQVSVRLPQKPKSITLQPEGTPLAVTWKDGLATVTVERLDLYSILVVDP